MRLLMHWSTATAQKKRKIQKKTWKRNRHDDNHAEIMSTNYRARLKDNLSPVCSLHIESPPYCPYLGHASAACS